MRCWKYSILIILQLSIVLAQIFELAPPANIESAGDNDQCATFCDKTYPAHTFEKSESSKSCKQGCRLFSMLQFVVGNRGAPANETVIRETCSSDCAEAYTDPSTRQACSDGCQHQTVHHSGPFQIKMDDSSPLFEKAIKAFQDQFSSFQQQMMQNFQNARNWFNNDFPQLGDMEQQMNNRMQEFMDQVEKSFGGADTDHLANPNNPIFNYADRFGRPQITQQTPDQQKNDNDKSKELHQKPLQTLSDPFKGPRVGNLDENNEPIIIVHMETNPISVPDNGRPEPVVPADDDHSDEDSTMLKENANEPSPPIDQTLVDDPDDDWLSCLARRARRLSVITRWMLCIALMLSVASMIWICLAIMRTAPRRRLLMSSMNEKKPIYDVVYSTPPANASDKSPMIISTKEPLTESPESPPPPYDVAPVHGKASVA